MSVFREDPYPAFNFLVEFAPLGAAPDSVVAGFSEVGGLQIEQPVIAYRNGNDRSLVPRLVPGLVSHAPLILSRGVTGSRALWDWMARCTEGDCERADGTISLLDEQRQVVMEWRVRGAMPCRLSGPRLDATAGRLAVECLELAYTGLELRD